MNNMWTQLFENIQPNNLSERQAMQLNNTPSRVQPLTEEECLILFDIDQKAECESCCYLLSTVVCITPEGRDAVFLYHS